MAELKIGTCSWKYTDWEGILYPEMGYYDPLEEYSKHLDTVEVDQWFWSLFGPDKVKLPDAGTVTDYRNSVPDDFTFTVKVPNSITLTHFHQKKKTDFLKVNPHFLSQDLFRKFMARINPLPLGPVMFQFEYLNRKKVPSQKAFFNDLEDFFADAPDGHAYGVETRNPNFLRQDYFDFLNRNQLCHVFVQGYYMPPVHEVYETWRDRIQDRCVIRLMGPNRKGIEKASGNSWGKIIAPRDAELKELATMVRDLLARDVTVYLNANNHYEGCAVLTIERFRRLLGE